jgi:hypothetical protein
VFDGHFSCTLAFDVDVPTTYVAFDDINRAPIASSLEATTSFTHSLNQSINAVIVQIAAKTYIATCVLRLLSAHKDADEFDPTPRRGRVVERG